VTLGKAISEIYHYMNCEYRSIIYITAALTELPIGKSKVDFISDFAKYLGYDGIKYYR